MPTPKRSLLWLLSILLLMAAAGGYAWHRWDQFRDEHGIVKFDWQGLKLSGMGFSLQRLSLIQQTAEGARLNLSANNIALAFGSIKAPLPPQSLSVDRIEMVWQPTPGESDQDDDLVLPDREQLQRWARWLPRNVELPSVNVSLPCASGVCHEQLALHWHHAGAQVLPAQLTIELQRNDHQLTLVADAHRQGADTHLNAQLSLDHQQRLKMQSRLNTGATEHQWLGSLAMSELPEAPWLLDWLSEWLSYEPTSLPTLPEAMRLGVGWALRFDAHADLPAALSRLDGDVRLSADLPTPWPIIGIGTMQGQLNLAVRAENGIWTPTDLTADLNLQPAPTLFAGIAPQLRPESVSLVISRGNADETPARLPLDVQLATVSANSTLSLQSRLLASTSAPFSATLQTARLQLQAARLEVSNFELQALSADLQLSGEANQEHVALHLSKGSRITLKSLDDGAGLSMANLAVSLQDMAFGATLDANHIQNFQLQGPASVEVGQINQPLLKPQSWHWSGQIDADSDRIELTGPLNNVAGLSMAVKLEQIWSSGAMQIEASLQEMFFRAGNPLAGTFTSWPALLELTTGRLQAKGQFSLPGATATATVDAKGLGGIYDRTELSGLDAQLALHLRDDQLRLDIQKLKLQQANPGFAFGPVLIRGEYLANTDLIDQGRIRWSTAQTALFGGTLWLDDNEVDLAADQQVLDVRLRGAQLSNVLKAYPTERLSGTGIIDGNVRLQRSKRGLSIDQGSLQAREPGGILRFRSAKIQALGQANPAMRLVTEALDDFHYDLLTSDVRYGEEGELTLGLRLHGRNPALEGGRPINFSINLEENIPALLTSLQLSDRVSETIQRRVQERLR